MNEFDQIIPDPLGLSSIDLKSVVVKSNAIRNRSKVTDSSVQKKKRMTTSSSQKKNILKRMIPKKNKSSDKGSKTDDKHTTNDEEDFETKSDCNETEIPEENRSVSVIPSQKNFSSATFLSYVHGYVSLPNLVIGMKNLELRLAQQSSRREDLVRQNFGLFICCVDGLTWLKDFQGLNAKKTDPKLRMKPIKKSLAQGRRVSFFSKGEDGEEVRKESPAHGKPNKGGLPEACIFLSKAKEEAQNTLAPILSRMKRSGQLKNADQILRRLASFMEYPHAMKQLMVKGDYESVLNIYHRVESLPATSNLRILKRITTKSAAIVEEMKQKLIFALMQPQPALSVVSRHMKLLNDLESEDVCRGILQRCFDRQAQHFEENVKNIASKLNDSLTLAFMKGQELNLNNKGSDKQLTPQDRRSSYVKGGGKNGPGHNNRRKNRAMTLLATAQKSFMDSMGEDDFLMDSDDEELKKVEEIGIPLPDFTDPDAEDNFLCSDKDSDTVSVSSMDSGSSAALENQNELRRILGAEFDKSFVDDDPDVDYTELLCNKVRVRDVTRMVDVIDQWLPSLHKIIQMLRTYSTNQPAMTPAQKRLTSFSSNLARGNMKGASVAYGRNQSVANESKKLADSISLAAEFLQTAILGINNTTASQAALQKNKLKEESKPMFADSISKSFQHMFQGTMVEPHLSETVMEVSEIYEVVESILSGRESAAAHSTHDDSSSEEMNFFGSSSFRESVLRLKAVAFDGENAVATKMMEQLIAQSVMLTSSVHKGNALTKKKVRDIDDIIRVFENITIKHLYSLVSIVRSPAWIAKVVWDYIQKILDRFISSLALMAASVESLNDRAYAENTIAKQLSFDDGDGSTEEKKFTGFDEVVSAARLELENLEASLLNTQHIQLAKNKSLDFVKACVRLRTSTVAKLWNETNRIFPHSPALSTGPSTFLRQGSTVVDKTPDKRGSASEQRRPSQVAAAQTNIEDRISLSTGSIIVLEENAVDKYLEFILLNFRTNTHASYSVIVKNEMTSEIESSRLNHRGLPTHISRILLDLGHIQSNLSSILTGMTVAASSEWKNNTTYENYLFHMICVSITTVFTDLVDSLARNSFSLHSTGRKYNARRLSNSSLVKGSSLSLLNGEDDDDETDVELRYYSKCKYPLSCGQALEELEFLKLAVLPMLLTQTDIPLCIWIHDENNTKNHMRKKYLSRDELMQEGLLFVEAIRNKSSVCRKK